MIQLSSLICLLSLICVIYAQCPGLAAGTPPSNDAVIPSPADYDNAVKDLDIMAVITRIKQAIRSSQSCFPADTFNGVDTYGPLFIRLAWHCAGTFRTSDDLGGCAGGRQRFEPERSWEDNTNLDKARALLAEIKEEFGDALSWGDLMVFAGTAAILDMEGPVSELCAGRVDEADGSASAPLGPGPEADMACPFGNGNCSEPLGASTIGLIYVNPEGFLGNPDPVRSSVQVREVFKRMDFDDRETVALIGGGHAFGKCHGPCPAGPGVPPKENITNPWAGECGTGIGADTYTSGFEGAWTDTPEKWSNQYFRLLVEETYEVFIGPGDKNQWRIANSTRDLLMLTSDIALIKDDDFKAIVEEFAADQAALDTAFADAWNKLTHRGGSWSPNMHCVNFTMTAEPPTTAAPADPVAPVDTTTAPPTDAGTTAPPTTGDTPSSAFNVNVCLMFVVLSLIFTLMY